MTRDQALSLAAPFFTYRDGTPCLRGEQDIHAFALLVASSVYSEEAKRFAEKALRRDVAGLDVVDRLTPAA